VAVGKKVRDSAAEGTQQGTGSAKSAGSGARAPDNAPHGAGGTGQTPGYESSTPSHAASGSLATAPRLAQGQGQGQGQAQVRADADAHTGPLAQQLGPPSPPPPAPVVARIPASLPPPPFRVTPPTPRQERS
jgi:hypothetical protein